MKFQRHTLQLLPDRQRRSYAGAAVVVLHGLDGRLSLQHEGRIIAAQEAPPSPGSLRNGIKPSSGDASQFPDPKARLYSKFRGSNGCHHVGTPPLMAGVGGFFTIRCQR